MKRTGAILVLLFVFGCATMIRADDKAAKKEIMSLYATVEKALKAKDVKGLTAYWTEDYAEKSEKGQTIGRKRAEANLTLMFGLVESIRDVTMKFGKFTAKGDESVLDVRMKVVGTSHNKQGQTVFITRETRERHTLTKTAEGWRLKRAEIKSQQMSMGAKTEESKARPPKK